MILTSLKVFFIAGMLKSFCILWNCFRMKSEILCEHTSIHAKLIANLGYVVIKQQTRCIQKRRVRVINLFVFYFNDDNHGSNGQLSIVTFLNKCVWRQVISSMFCYSQRLRLIVINDCLNKESQSNCVYFALLRICICCVKGLGLLI
eukprot:TRINITY_DN16563_c0_g1_i1.p3 TRINITY_DN16563_c0_g1~~TRINITY_DN16563_c0_g1_i1.p3  ORF type:complete len:147 (+),score=0.76 TRINITY_DN16563_c0_g1_i1:689-1129(+)